MPWCPKCKNEYKAGFTVCADCGCNLIEELGNEIIAYWGSEEEIDKLVDYLNSKGFDFAYKQYNSKEGHYELLIQESKKDEIRESLKDYFIKAKASVVEESNDDVFGGFDEDDYISVKRYKKPSERAEEYKSGFQTMLLVGIVGLVALFLIDFGVIPIKFSKESTILINIVMGGMFVVFILIGINSFKTYKKLKSQSSQDDELENKIVDWFNQSIKIDDVTANENKNEAEELLYFRRFKSIKRLINNEFIGLDASFVEYVADKLYNEMFK